MSRENRKAMVRRDHPKLSLSRQCEIVSISRSSFYHQPKGESTKTLALMRQIDELFMKYPFFGNRQIRHHLRRSGVKIGRHRVCRLMRLMGPCAIYQAPSTSKPHPEHRIYPYLLHKMTIDLLIRSGAAISPISRSRVGFCTSWRSWTGQRGKCCLGGCQTRWMCFFALRLWKKPLPGSGCRGYSTRIRAASSPALLLPACCVMPRSKSPWMGGADAWTIYSSNGCGAP